MRSHRNTRRVKSPAGPRGPNLRLEILERRCLLSGYDVTLNSPYEVGTSIAANATDYTDIADFQATDPNGNPVTDPAGFSATILWGDGTSSTASIVDYPGLAGLFQIDGDHAYPNPGNGEYSVQVVLTDPDGGTWFGAPSIATVDARPDDLGVTPVGNDTFSVTDGQTLTSPIAVVGTPDPSLTVTGLTGQITDQSSGATIAAKIVPTGEFTWDVYDTEPFTDPGPNEVTVRLADYQGDSTTLQGKVTVTAPSSNGSSAGSGQPARGNPNRAGGQQKLHVHKSGTHRKPSHLSTRGKSTIPIVTPSGPLQLFFANPRGYTTYEFVGLKFNHQTPSSVMHELQKNPSRYFPFPITNNNPARTTGPIVAGKTYKLTPVPLVTGVLRAVNVTPTSFTLVVISDNYVVPAGSRITFKTVLDSRGDVLLEQQAAVSNPLFVWPDQTFGPPAWAQQAANLRRDLGYTF
jgi:hypothetical protein